MRQAVARNDTSVRATQFFVRIERDFVTNIPSDREFVIDYKF